MDLNKFARGVTLKEGKKKQQPIGQIKETIRITMALLAKEDDGEILRTVKRFRPGR